jgi:hypothetical protein
VVHDALDLSVPLEVANRNTSEGAADLESLDEDGLRDELEGRDLLHDTVKGRLVEGDGMLRLVLDLAFRPLLLLGRLTARRWRRGFSFGLGTKPPSEKCERLQLGHPLARRQIHPRRGKS